MLRSSPKRSAPKRSRLSTNQRIKLDDRLFAAVKRGNLTTVRRLIRQGADPNAWSAYGIHPLHVAVDEGHTAVVNELIRRKADVNVRTSYDETPLHRAIGGPPEIVEALVKAGANPDIKDCYGHSVRDHVRFLAWFFDPRRGRKPRPKTRQ